MMNDGGSFGEGQERVQCRANPDQETKEMVLSVYSTIRCENMHDDVPHLL